MNYFYNLLVYKVLSTLVFFFVFVVAFAITSVESFSQTQITPPYGISLEEWEQLQTIPDPNGTGISQITDGVDVFDNGGFETGDFTGWVTQDMTIPFFPLQVGGAGISPFGFISDPPEGSFAALHGFDGDGPGTIRIAQDITLHAAAQFVDFDYRGAWSNAGTMDRVFSVSVEPSGGGTALQTDVILTAVAGTNIDDTGNLHGSVNISAFANQSVRITFDWFVPETFTGPAFFQFDDVFVSPPIPVELTAFTAVVLNDDVELNWNTATETNNMGFEIQRRTGDGEFEKVGFVPGHGTTTEIQSYSYADLKVASGNYTYRLKQMDYDGSFEYSSEVAVDVTVPLEFVLEQNYPNPFNPSTVIKYSIPENGFVTLDVYNLLGEKVASLVNGVHEAGRYEVNFDASSLASGVYVYTISAGSFNLVKKMLLMK
jgi:hypothetical protein